MRGHRPRLQVVKGAFFMFKIYARAIGNVIAQTLGDIRGILFNPRVTLQEIAERKNWGVSLGFLFLMVLIGLPGLFAVQYKWEPRIHGFSYHLSIIPFVPLLGTPLLLISLCLFMWCFQRSIRLRQFLQLVGYTGVPWIIFILSFFSVVGLFSLFHVPMGFNYYNFVNDNSSWGVSIMGIVLLFVYVSLAVGFFVFSIQTLILTIRLMMLVLKIIYPMISGIRSFCYVIGAMLLTSVVLSVTVPQKFIIEHTVRIWRG